MIACGSEPSPSQGQDSSNSDTSATSTEEYTDDTTPPRSNHDCTVAGKVLDGNQLWLREREVLAVILADSSTYDPNYEDSHRVLEIYDTKSCERIARHELPVNESPDFPYYLADINYNNSSQLVAIRGFNSVYCYDIQNKQLLPQLSPEFKSERYGSDASAGMINRVEVWENYLVGYAQEFGAFVFDMSQSGQAKAVMPFAEYEVPEEGFASLFLLNEDDQTVQAILPAFDVNEGEFSINPIFSKPKKVNTNIPANARNNRFLVLREENEAKTPIALDLLEHKEMPLPTDVAAKKTQDILKWMRSQ